MAAGAIGGEASGEEITENTTIPAVGSATSQTGIR